MQSNDKKEMNSALTARQDNPEEQEYRLTLNGEKAINRTHGVDKLLKATAFPKGKKTSMLSAATSQRYLKER
jgi:hypothetical protein